MGNVKTLLYSKPLASPAPAYYADKRSIESAESLHVHERNLRLEYTLDELEALIDALVRTGERPVVPLGPETTYLDLSDLPPESGISPRRFEVEESTYPTLPETTIHLHYRNLRIEFSHAEWREFHRGVSDAWRAWLTREGTARL